MKNAETSQHRSDRLARIARSLFTSFCLLSCALPSRAEAPAAPAKQPPAVTATWEILDGVATLGLDRTTLSNLGFTMTDLTPTITGHALHPLSVVPAGSPAFALGRIGLRAIVAWDGFRGFEGTSMATQGGFRLVGPAGTFDFSNLTLRPGPKMGSLELVDAAGMALFTTGDAQWLFDAPSGKLRYLNADLRILPDLARLMGDEVYTGVGVGVLDVDMSLAADRLPPVPALPAGINAPPPCGDWSGTVDVSLTNMSSIGQAGIATVNGRSVVVVLPSADLKNVGTANVPWFAKFTNLGVAPWNDQHPFLVWQMARTSASGDIYEPLGKSDLKHAFLTLNTGCDAGACTDSSILGSGCSDVYGTGTNNSTGSLAPRSEVSASTGIWAHCGGIPSHFDTNGDCSQDFSGSGENSFTHGLKAAETDLMVAGAKYYVEAFYIIRNDVNIFNSMGFRQVTPTKPGATWSFPTVGGYVQGPAINTWVNPTTPGADASNQTLDTGEGKVQLAVKVTDVTGSPGRKRFAYALQNHDFDRQIKSFHIPFDMTGASITNVTYVDGDGFAANNWTSTIDATGITWNAPTGTTPPAPVDYATVVAFRFDIDRAAVPATVTLGAFEAGTPTLSIQGLAPADPQAPPQGSFFTVNPCRLVDTRGGNGPALVPGQERIFNSSGICGIPAGAKALAINVTAIDAAAAGHVVVFSGTFPTSATINYGVGQTRANNAIVGLEADGSFKVVAVQGTGTLQLTVDVSGYFQ